MPLLPALARGSERDAPAAVLLLAAVCMDRASASTTQCHPIVTSASIVAVVG